MLGISKGFFLPVAKAKFPQYGMATATMLKTRLTIPK